MLRLQSIYELLSLLYLSACWVVSRSVWLCELSMTTSITPAKKPERHAAKNHAVSQSTKETRRHLRNSLARRLLLLLSKCYALHLALPQAYCLLQAVDFALLVLRETHLTASQTSADILPVAPEGKSGVSAATEAAVQEAIGHPQDPLANLPYSIDTRPISQQRSE